MTRSGFTRGGIVALLVLAACNAEPPEQGNGGGGALRCRPGALQMCQCLGGTVAMQTCAADGSAFSACPCGGTAGTTALAGTAGTTAQAGVAGTVAGSSAGTAADGGGGANAGAAGEGGAGAGGASGDGAAGTDGSDPFAEVRQVCVDTINTYRATKGLPAMTRATPSEETCSDQGAKKDGDSMDAHSSAGDCAGFGAQDTCPGWGVGGFTGNATLADALKKCLQSMWNEGEPPVSREACIKDYQNCFLKHGHYLNMTSEATVVSCGFYEMSNGDYWMNQDFKR